MTGIELGGISLVYRAYFLKFTHFQMWTDAMMLFFLNMVENDTWRGRETSSRKMLHTITTVLSRSSDARF